MPDEDDGYYIYGLIDPAAKRRTKDDLLSIFYVGKGITRRMFDHEREVLANLRAEVDLVPRGSKAERIRDILERGETIPAVRLSAGYTDEKDALRAEALAIALVNSVLKQAGQPELTNSNRGYHAGFLPMREYIKFILVEDFLIPPDATEQVLLVKGDTRELPAGGHQLLQHGLRDDLTPWRGRIKILGYGAQKDEFSRPGWDPETHGMTTKLASAPDGTGGSAVTRSRAGWRTLAPRLSTCCSPSRPAQTRSSATHGGSMPTGSGSTI